MQNKYKRIESNIAFILNLEENFCGVHAYNVTVTHCW